MRRPATVAKAGKMLTQQRRRAAIRQQMFNNYKPEYDSAEKYFCEQYARIFGTLFRKQHLATGFIELFVYRKGFRTEGGLTEQVKRINARSLWPSIPGKREGTHKTRLSVDEKLLYERSLGQWQEGVQELRHCVRKDFPEELAAQKRKWEEVTWPNR
jgi:hypothetical protein